MPKLDLPLDDISAGDGCEDGEHFGHAYWAVDQNGISVCAHVYFENRTDEEEAKINNDSTLGGWVTPPILKEKCFWYFADNISLPYTRECGLRTFGLKSTDDVDVHIMLNDGTGEVLHLPYIENPNPEFALRYTDIDHPTRSSYTTSTKHLLDTETAGKDTLKQTRKAFGALETIFYREIGTAMDNAQLIADECHDEESRQRYYGYFNTLQSISNELDITRP
jgi:hypothetical protein